MAKKVSKKAPAKKTTKKVTKKVTKKSTKKTAKKVTKKAAPKKASAKKAPVKKTTTKNAPAKKAAPKKQSAGVVKTPTLKVGDKAPDFTLLNQDGEEVSLHDFLGMNVVVYFYPKAMTPGCTVQACEIRNSQKQLTDMNIAVLGISADPVKSLKKFQERDKLTFPLLSDPEKNVIGAYGSWGPKKFMGREFDGILRQSFLIDPDGKIVHIMHKVNTKTHHTDIMDVFKNL